MTTLQGDLDAQTATAGRELTRVREQMSLLDGKRTRLHEALLQVNESWSGSNLGYHADLYYGAFQRPPLGARFDPEWGAYNGLPEGWRDRDLAEVRAAIEQLSGVAIDQYTSAATEMVERVRMTITEVAIVIAPIRQLDGLDREAELLDGLESFDLEPSLQTSVPAGMTRDSRAVAEGRRIAPHQQARHAIGRAAQSIDACEKAMTLAERLLRQVSGALRARSEQRPPVEQGQDTGALVASLLRSFGPGVRVLQDRGRGRAGFQIADEYDVQDLVHMILRLHAEDVRPEEVTPSYAGSSKRIDFLLKREQVAVEVKMTRASLRDREIGSQLSEDILHYRSHQDARTLVCFVYDPERLIANHRGIEDDLAGASDERLRVLVVIAQ